MRSPVPSKMFTKFRYSTTVSINPSAAGLVAEYVFSANGMYDPDITAVGHQPRGFDQFIGVLYDHYVVVGSKLTARFDNSNNTSPILCMVKTQDSAQSTVNRTDWQEDSLTRRTLCGSGTSARSYATVVKKVNIGRFLGRSKVLSDPQLKGSAGANPTENVFFHIGACAVDDSLDLNAIPIQVDIDFIAVLIERRNPAQS